MEEKKMKKRNFLAALLAFVLVLCVGMFASCGIDDVATATTITLDVNKLGTLKAGDSLDVNKLKITVGYSDNTQKDITVADVTLTVDDKAYNKEPLTEGEHTIKVSYVSSKDTEPLTAEAKISVSHAHNYGEVHTGTPATCTTAGSKDYYECSCGKKFVKDGEEYVETTDLAIPAKGHDFEHGTEVEGSRIAATCVAEGKYTIKCANCDETKEIELEIDENAHDFEGQPYVNGGVDGHYQVCKNNGEHHSETEAHAGGTATCEKLAKCDKCNAEYGALADHDYGDIVPAKPATIDEAGNVEYKDCNVCHKHFDKDGNKLENVVLPQLEAVTIKFVGIERADIRIEKGTTTTIEEPVLADNVFVNWTDADGKVVDVTAAFNEDITLTANFKEGYNFKKNHTGATATTATEGAAAGTVSVDGTLDTGIRYNLPTADALYNITLPCINYNNFKVVVFNWKATAWTQVGTNSDRNHGQDVIEGIFQIVKVGDVYKTIFRDTTGGHMYQGEIGDADVLNGTKGLAVIYANAFAANRWFDIEVADVSHVYDDGVLQRVALSADGSNYIVNYYNKDTKYNQYDPSGLSGNWTVALQAIDYTKYTSVTFNWNFSGPWARLGLNNVSEVFDVGTSMSGTLAISKNAEGKYVATLTNTSVENGGTCTKVLSDDVVNGKKGLVIYFGSDVTYKQFNIDAVPTFA